MVSETPWRDDSVTIACPRCGQPFTPVGRQRFCSTACRQSFWRRNQAAPLPMLTRQATPSVVIYECPSCETRLLGQQHCPDCGLFCRRVGPGGLCPHCEEPVALADLLHLPNKELPLPLASDQPANPHSGKLS